MSWRENKAEWKTSAAGVLIYDSGSCCSVLLSPIPPPRGQRGARKKTTAHAGQFFYSSNFKIYWDWLVFANNSQANSSTKHWNQKRPTRLAPTPKQEAHGCKNVSWSVLSTEKKKKKSAQEHLKSARNKTAVKTGQFFFSFWLFNTFCYKQVHDNHWYKVSIILNNIPNENKQASSATFYKSKTLWNLREKINNI